jgi:murein DD-endopeptidase MepM/ murein hydrolase activator NlpD
MSNFRNTSAHWQHRRCTATCDRDEMHQRFARLLAALICVASVSAFMPAAHPDDSVQDARDSIETAKDNREDARRGQLEAEAELEVVNAEDIQVVGALEAASELVNLQQAKVDAAQQRLGAANEAATQAEADVGRAAEAIQVLKALAVDYAVESYVGLSASYTEAWLEADDATTGAHKVALLETLSSETNDVLDRLRAIEDRRQDLLAEAAAFRLEANAIQADLDIEFDALEAKQAVQIELKAELDARRAAWEASLAEAEAAERQLTNFIKSEEKRVKELLAEKRREALAAAARAAGRGQANIGAVTTTGWIWPTAGGIASPFGQRLHPILGYYRMHTGLDVGGRPGQSIWAANEGIVIRVGYNGGYGNSVVVQHDNGVTTVYAHMSGFGNIAVGDFVFAGDTIGYVGSTGLSTGPHLHFEIRVSGVPIDPLLFMP